jgi:hypothetical protein
MGRFGCLSTDPSVEVLRFFKKNFENGTLQALCGGLRGWFGSHKVIDIKYKIYNDLCRKD